MNHLRVRTADLQRLAGQISELATTLTTPPVPAPADTGSWQTSVAAADKARAGAAANLAALKARLQSTADRFATAATAYTSTDDDSASELGGQVV